MNSRLATRRDCLRASLALGAALHLPASKAQPAQEEWPRRPIKIIVPFGAGSGTDIVARLLSERLPSLLGQPVIVENKAGASGLIGAQAAAESPADGYTLMLGTQTTHGANSGMFKSLPYDPVRSFAPVSLLATVPFAMVVHPSLGVKSLPEFVARARAHPEKFTSSYGAGASQVVMEMFKAATGTKLLGVAYKSSPQALTAVAAGEVHCMMEVLSTARPMAEGGRIQVLAVSGKSRSRLMPDVPTFNELGFAGFDVGIWYALFAPRGAPDKVIERLSAAVQQVMRAPETREKMLQSGYEPSGSSPRELATIVNQSLQLWTDYTRKAGITPQ
jgi:tripartite-type tricarboxylate transporter receptor subunit TctC